MTRVLVVEDEESYSDALAYMLRKEGFEATVVTDGPYVETKEHMAGLWIWEAPDLDVALALATEGSRACNRRLEIRPLLSE